MNEPCYRIGCVNKAHYYVTADKRREYACTFHLSVTVDRLSLYAPQVLVTVLK